MELPRTLFPEELHEPYLQDVHGAAGSTLASRVSNVFTTAKLTGDELAVSSDAADDNSLANSRLFLGEELLT